MSPLAAEQPETGMSNGQPDLNLFRVFAAVMERRNLAAAGRDLGISGSAVSHALARLRVVLGDDLFIIGGAGMSPTARAVELAPEVGAALGGLAGVLASKPFDPANTKRVFKMGVSECSGDIFVPGLLDRLLRQAPGVRLEFVPIGRIDLVKHLDEGRLDLAVTSFGSKPERIRRRILFEEREAFVVRRDHPLARGKSDKSALASYPHLIVDTSVASKSANDVYSNESNRRRQLPLERMTIVTIPSVGLVAPVLNAATTDLIALIPRRLARQIVASHDFVMLDLTYEPDEVTTEIGWHERGDRDIGLLWMLGQVEAVCAALDASASLSSGSPSTDGDVVVLRWNGNAALVDGQT